MLLRMSDLWVPKAGKTTGITSADSPIQIHTVRPASASSGACNREKCKFSIHTIIRTYARSGLSQTIHANTGVQLSFSSLPLQIARSLKHSPRGREVSSLAYAIAFKLTYRQLSANFCPYRSLWSSFSQATPAPCTQICHHGFLSEAKSLTLVPVSLQAMPRQLRGPTSCCRFGLLICSLQVAQETVSLQYALISVVSTTLVQTDALGPTLDGHVI